MGLLHFVWWRALTYAPSGDLSDFTDGQIARWADWDGEPGHLVSALKTAGFVDAQRTIHDWDDFAGRWIDRRAANAERMRIARTERKNGARPASVQRTCAESVGLPDLNRTGPNLTGPDRTGTTPQPPASGGRKTRGRTAEPEPTSSLTPEEIQEWMQR